MDSLRDDVIVVAAVDFPFCHMSLSITNLLPVMSHLATYSVHDSSELQSSMGQNLQFKSTIIRYVIGVNHMHG